MAIESTGNTAAQDHVRVGVRVGPPGPLSANPIAVMFAASLRSAPTLKRGRGRPRKKDASFYADVLRGHLGVVAWHQETYGAPARSDAALYKAFRWHVAETVEVDGVVALAARDAALGPRLKTVLNTLAEARAFFKTHPEKHPFTGTDATVRSESNCLTAESTTHEHRDPEPLEQQAEDGNSDDRRGAACRLQ
jgi:hypothetical protein